MLGHDGCVIPTDLRTSDDYVRLGCNSRSPLVNSSDEKERNQVKLLDSL